MIKSEMRNHQIEIGTEEVFEIEVCEFENEDFSCLETKYVLLVGADEEEMRAFYETAAQQHVADLNKVCGGLREGGLFYGLRFTRYVLEADGNYQPIDGEEYYGEFEETDC